MSTRPVLRIPALLGATVLIHYLLKILVWQPSDADLMLAWVLQPLGAIVSYTWACYVIWAIAAIIVSIRLRDSRPAPRVLWLGVGAMLASVVGPIVGAIALVQWGGSNPPEMVLYVVMMFAIPFTVAALASIVLVELIMRRSTSPPVDTGAIGASPVR